MVSGNPCTTHRGQSKQNLSSLDTTNVRLVIGQQKISPSTSRKTNGAERDKLAQNQRPRDNIKGLSHLLYAFFILLIPLNFKINLTTDSPVNEYHGLSKAIAFLILVEEILPILFIFST